MEVIESCKSVQEKSESFRRKGHTIALVPTMGFFHQGHIELMKVGRKHSDKLIVSIFVNPMQFGPAEDFETYPRDLDGDLAKAREIGVDVVFAPSVGEMYPEGFQTKVVVEKVTRNLCGKSRPGHFDGVATVVAKLFHLTKPHLAIFGQKDYQQLTVISRMVKDLSMDVQIIGLRTVREPDGLAMSSRNSYLSPEERKSALCLKKSLNLAHRMFQEGETDAREIRSAMEKLIREHPFTEIEYVSVCNPVTLEEIDRAGKDSLVALAVKVGTTRLIDNCIIGRGPS
ncbi:MAG: pantoate--beta-alanine ligase [Deltaproteobacteria bacterium]|nr:pantoate--beta-alanine ligase [Deltaproteobacteria bacterium]